MCHSGTLFESRQYIMDNQKTGRPKMLILHNFEGYLWVHRCFFCTTWKSIPTFILQMAHFRKKVWQYPVYFSPNLTKYTKPIQQEINYLIS